MGVRDLTSIAKKFAPSCFTPQPSIRAFAGQRFAIDANLLTTKFWFAGRSSSPSPSGSASEDTSSSDGSRASKDSRSLTKAWYYFLVALRRENIRPIVVFDGATRVKEKAKENERRGLARQLQRLRGEAEAERGERLRRTKEVWSGVVADRRASLARVFTEEVRIARRMAAESEAVGAKLSGPSTLPFGHREAVAPPLVDPPDQLFPFASPSSTAFLSLPPTEQSIILSLLDLYRSFLFDSTNPIWSRNQRQIVEEEQAFFQAILKTGGRIAEPAESNLAEPPAQVPLEAEEPSLKFPPLRLPSLETAGSREEDATRELDKLEETVEGEPNPVPEVESAEEHSVKLPPLPLPPLETAGSLEEDVAPELDSFGELVEGELDALPKVESAEEETDEDLDAIIGRSDKLGASHLSRSVFVPKEAFEDVRSFVHALGIPYLEPSPSDPHEAEGVCSALYHLGLVDYVVSDDTDVAVYGAQSIRRISTTTEAKEDGLTRGGKVREGMSVMDPQVLRRELGLTKEEFVDWALLCGTDFTERIPHLGPATALKLVRQHSTIEAILEVLPARFIPPGGDSESYLQTIRDARTIFLSMPRLSTLAPSSPPSSSSSTVGTEVSPADEEGWEPTHPLLSKFSGSLNSRPPTSDLPTLLYRFGLPSEPWNRTPGHSIPAPVAPRWMGDEDEEEDGQDEEELVDGLEDVVGEQLEGLEERGHGVLEARVAKEAREEWSEDREAQQRKLEEAFERMHL
ncbi:hypothetical protein JCM11641_006077 [Rhodosporidiobolus odoratus]